MTFRLHGNALVPIEEIERYRRFRESAGPFLGGDIAASVWASKPQAGVGDGKTIARDLICTSDTHLQEAIDAAKRHSGPGAS